MNPSTTTSTTELAGRGRTKRSAGRKVRIMLVGVAASILSAFGLATTTAQPADAAGGVSYCFRHAGGGAYTYDAYLMLYMNGRWTSVQNLGRSVNGCKSVTISGWWQNYPATVRAYYSYGGFVWSGWAPYYAPAGWASYNVGTGYVNR